MEIINNQGKWAELLAQVRASDFMKKTDISNQLKYVTMKVALMCG